MCAVSEEAHALQMEFDRILNSEYSIKGYIHPLFQLLIKDKGLLRPDDRIALVDALYDERTLPEALSTAYPGKQYVLLFYAHNAHSRCISFTNRDYQPQHTSLVLGIVGDKRTITDVLNIDGYEYLPFVDILGTTTGRPHPQIHERLLITVPVGGSAEREPLQKASMNNLNCPLYAFAMAEALLKIDRINPTIIDAVFETKFSLAACDDLGREILLDLRGKYLDDSGSYDSALCRRFHYTTRTALRDFVSEHRELAKAVMATRAPPERLAPKRCWEYVADDTALVRTVKNQPRTEMDNYSIAASAVEVLHARGLDNFYALLVGPDRPDGSFCLKDQLTSQFKVDKRYTFFALPTEGKHAVTVVIDSERKECYVVDPMSHPANYDEAIAQLRDAIGDGVLTGYTLIQPPAQQTAQQSDDLSCGIHTAANIVGIILGKINVATGEGLGMRTRTEVRALWELFAIANEMHQKKLAERAPKLAEVRHILDAFNNFKEYSPALESSLDETDQIIAVLKASIPADDFSKLKSIPEIVTELTSISADSVFIPLFRDEDLMRTLSAGGDEWVNAVLISEALKACYEKRAKQACYKEQSAKLRSAGGGDDAPDFKAN